MLDERVLEIVNNYRTEFLKAQKRYGSLGDALSNKSNSTRLSMSDLGKAYELIDEGVRITEDYFIACEAIILGLDSNMRGELCSLSVMAVGAISELMDEIVNDMNRKTTSFNVSLDGQHLLKSDLMPKPGIQGKSIQLFWKQQYQTMPGYEQEERRKKQEKLDIKAAKEIATQKAQETALAAKEKIAALIEAAEMETRSQVEKSKLVEQKQASIKKQCEQALKDFQAAVQATFDQHSKDIEQACSVAIAKIQKERKQYKESAKMHGTNRGASYEEQLKKYKYSIKFIQTDIWKSMLLKHYRRELEFLVQDYERTLTQYTDSCFSSQKIVQEINIPKLSVPEHSFELDDTMETVYDIFSYGGWTSMKEIPFEEYGLSRQRASVALSKLVRLGLLVRVMNEDVAYFGPSGQVFHMETTVWNEVTEQTEKPIPRPPSINLKPEDCITPVFLMEVSTEQELFETDQKGKELFLRFLAISGSLLFIIILMIFLGALSS